MSANLDVERVFLFCLGVTIGSVLSGFTYSPFKVLRHGWLGDRHIWRKLFLMSPLDLCSICIRNLRNIKRIVHLT